jgi:hypothetical protein
MDRYRRTHCMASISPDLNPRDFYLWEHLKTLVYAAQMERHFTIALWMPV